MTNYRDRMHRLSLLEAHVRKDMFAAMDSGGGWKHLADTSQALSERRASLARSHHGENWEAARADLLASFDAALAIVSNPPTATGFVGARH